MNIMLYVNSVHILRKKCLIVLNHVFRSYRIERHTHEPNNKIKQQKSDCIINTYAVVN